MDQHSIIQNIWFILTIWAIVYLSDYYLTIFTVKRIRENLNNHIQHEGSFELTPIFQDDVDNLRIFSPRFFSRWLLSLLFIYGLWWISFKGLNWPQYFYFFIGALLLREFAIHLRHLRNLAASQSYNVRGISGQIAYKRWYLLKLSAAEMLSFGLLYLIFGIFYGSWFFFGGVFGCWIVAYKHWRFAKKAIKSQQLEDQTSSE